MQFSTSIISFLFPYRFSTLNSGNNMPDIHQNGVDGQLPEYENYYQNGNIYVYVFMYII